MKNKLHILVCITVLSVLPLLAGDSEARSLTVEQRLREAEISVALRHYERVKMEVFETSLKLDLLSTDEEMTDAARKKRAELLNKRLEILQRHADSLRANVQQLGAEIAKAK